MAVIFSEAVQDKRFMDAVTQVLSDLSWDPKVIQIMSDLAASVFARPEVQRECDKILSKASSAVLVNEEVIYRSREFVADVVGDDQIQREGGDALWNSIIHALRPGMAKLGGATLICASVMLGQLFISPY